jgi:GT2 family glycosyltransferase
MDMKLTTNTMPFGAEPAVKPVAGSKNTACTRPEVRGKFLWVGNDKLYLRGVTYGPFRADQFGDTYPAAEVVERDFAMMAAQRINAIRTYNAPPQFLLDLAQAHGLWVMVGLQAERHFAFLDDPNAIRDIREQIRAGVRRCAGHPAVLCYTLANEIPGHVVRWHGARRIERFLEDLLCIAKKEDPKALYTYANYPTTEYLDLPFLDLACFNVFLESEARLEAYLARLQNLAGDRPLIMSEVGLDSGRNGEVAQAQALDWQIRTAFAMGCAGAFVFSWTDEWYNRGGDVEDWHFGVTDRTRKPKLALRTLREAFAEVPFAASGPWPRVSVVVCSFNGSRTIRQCLEGLEKLRYRNFEVIVIDDGSQDATADIARQYKVRLIQTENRGLSAARNLGQALATGEIVAYLDDDASPDPDWLSYLADTFHRTNCVGVGGPNIPFADDGEVAACVAHTPGRPTHVLLSDSDAEHVPGCNMAFRRDWLRDAGGFDTQFRVAGDDVDVCWRVRNSGGKLVFSPAAMVWHHCRKTVPAFWKQQVGYGKAEAMLEKKWPEKYSRARRIAWRGRIYNDGLLRAVSNRRSRIYQGTWGSAGYTGIYHPPLGFLDSLPAAPEWILTNVILLVLSLTALFWARLIFAPPLLLLSVASGFVAGTSRAVRARFSFNGKSRFTRIRLVCLTAFLNVQQAVARLWGSLSYEAKFWRPSHECGSKFPLPHRFRLWTERRKESFEWLQTIESAVRTGGAVVRRGGDYDPWDLEVCCSVFGYVRIRLLSEDYNDGKQLVRVHAYPKIWSLPLSLIISLLLLASLAILDEALVAGFVLAFLSLPLAALAYRSFGIVTAAVCRSLTEIGFGESSWRT